MTLRKEYLIQNADRETEMGVYVKNQYASAVLVLYFLLIITQVILKATGNRIPAVMVDVLLLMLFMFRFIKNNKIINNKTVNLVFLLLLLQCLLWGLLLRDSVFAMDAFVQMGLSVVTIIIIFGMADFIHRYSAEREFILVTYYAVSACIVISYLNHFDNFVGLIYVTRIFSPDERYRNAFGLGHYNHCAMFCLIALMFSYLFSELSRSSVYNRRNRLIKNTMFAINPIIVTVLLSTGCRNGITAILVFFAVLLYLNFKPKNKLALLLKTIAVSAILFVTVAKVTDESGISLYDLLNNYSGRVGNFLINIPLLVDNNKLLFGFGYVDKTAFVNCTAYHFGPVDNWYLYMLVTTGVFGLIWIVFIFGKLFISLMKTEYRGLRFRNGIIAVFITNLYTGLFENTVFYPGFLQSTIFMILFFSYLYHKSSARITGLT